MCLPFLSKRASFYQSNKYVWEIHSWFFSRVNVRSGIFWSMYLPQNFLHSRSVNIQHRCGSRIWSRGGGPASEAESCWHSEAESREGSEHSAARLKYTFSHILETLFLLFLTSILTPKVEKNRALDFTSINLRHSDMLHLFVNLHEKVML